MKIQQHPAEFPEVTITFTGKEAVDLMQWMFLGPEAAEPGRSYSSSRETAARLYQMLSDLGYKP